MAELDEATEEDIGAIHKGRWGVVLTEILDVLSAYFRRSGKPDDEAAKLASGVTIQMAKHFGGRPVYLPKGKLLETSLMHEEIYRRHNGQNTIELADEYRISTRQVLKIIVRQRELHRKKRQGLA